jgi:hypothetical protein
LPSSAPIPKWTAGRAGDQTIAHSAGTVPASGGIGFDALDAAADGGDTTVDLQSGIACFRGERFRGFDALHAGGDHGSVAVTAGFDDLCGGSDGDVIDGKGCGDFIRGGMGE